MSFALPFSPSQDLLGLKFAPFWTPIVTFWKLNGLVLEPFESFFSHLGLGVFETAKINANIGLGERQKFESFWALNYNRS